MMSSYHGASSMMDGPGGYQSMMNAAGYTYQYLCPVPGHAQEGMTGTFTVSNTN